MEATSNPAHKEKVPMSPTRRVYFLRLIGRILTWIGCILLCVFAPQTFDVLEGWNFFHEFSILHILWVIWLIDMIHQLIPAKHYIALGSQKLFLDRFRPAQGAINYPALRKHVISTTKAAYKVFLLWAAVIMVIGVLVWLDVLDTMGVFMFSVFFYVCDLICVLIWCPFRLMMKNRCCTTCRIFNWDHLMMFTPFLFVRGFFTQSLLIVAFVVWLVWELCVMLYPERFWEGTNEALRCTECTDKLCTQYCRKLR